MDLAEGCDGLQRRALHRGEARHVAHDGRGRNLPRLQIGLRRLKRLLVDVGEHDLHALAPEGARHGEAQPRGPACDEGDLVFQIQRHVRFLPCYVVRWFT